MRDRYTAYLPSHSQLTRVGFPLFWGKGSRGFCYTYREGPVGGLMPKPGIWDPATLAGRSSLLCSLRLSRASLTALSFGGGGGGGHMAIVELQTDVNPRLPSGSHSWNTNAPSFLSWFLHPSAAVCHQSTLFSAQASTLFQATESPLTMSAMCHVPCLMLHISRYTSHSTGISG